MIDELLQKWNKRYQSAEATIPAASEVLVQNQHLLPEQGKVLDLACGLAGNAALMANAGLETSAWDFSPAAIEKLNALISHVSLSRTVTPRETWLYRSA